MNLLSVALTEWLAANAEELDSHADNALEVLPRPAEAGLLKIGVPASLGGDGRKVAAAVDCIAQVAEYSQTAAFVLWAQRTFALSAKGGRVKLVRYHLCKPEEL